MTPATAKRTTAEPATAGATTVCLELGKRRVFAAALDWPGWCRSGKDEHAALTALATAGPRYASVATLAGVVLPAVAADHFDVVERLAGSMTTDFGAPGSVAAAEHAPLTAPAADRVASLVQASWDVFAAIVAGAPAQLRKGPRGGGRDRDGIVDHVVGAEAAYARKLGIRQPAPTAADPAGVAALREAITAALRSARVGEPQEPKGWPPRYAARRIAWHVLDHAWEIEDRSPA